MSDGIYYIPKTDKLVIFSNVEHWWDDETEFAIVRWEGSTQTHNRIFLDRSMFKDFIHIGEL